MSKPADRLKAYLETAKNSGSIDALTADASTREYFRIAWDGSTAIACSYPEPFTASVNSYDDVTGLFLAAGLPVAKLVDVNTEFGVIIQEDLGDRILLDALQGASPSERDRLIDEAISIIARIQAATELAFDRRSLASRLRFDTQKLVWELNYFKEHYFGTYLRRSLPSAYDHELTNEFIKLSADLADRATVLCHRDYHAANLMLDRTGRLRIIDHQDARIGSPAYDLVSLLLDRVTERPTDTYIETKSRLLLNEREKAGLEAIDERQFGYEFTLQTIQRCLKAAGTFSYQSTVRGKTYFIPFIEPMLRIAGAAAQKCGGFDAISDLA